MRKPRKMPGAQHHSNEGPTVFDMSRVAHRLREIRRKRGKSLQDAAEVLKLPHSTMADMENGDRAVSVRELERLADLYAWPAWSFLCSEDDDPFSAWHRACPEVETESGIDSEMRRLLDCFATGMSLRRFLGWASEPRIPDYSARMTRTDEAIRQGEAAAKEERRRLGLGHAPLREIPDMVDLQGAWVVEADLFDGLSGLFISHPAVGMAILVNSQDDPARKQVSYTHGYAHALFDRDETVTATREGRPTGLVGMRANAFASAFLMPADGIERWLASIGKGQPGRHTHIAFDGAAGPPVGAEMRPRPVSQTITYQDVALLARYYGVGFDAVVWRLGNLRHIGDTKTRELIGQRDLGEAYLKLVGHGDLARDTGNPKRAITSQLVHLGTEAFRQGKISRGRLAEIGRSVGIEREHLLKLAFATCPDLDKIPV